jgi:DNA-3-methyladenine glycosylase I
MDSKKRCKWCLGDPLYESYHDLEWGVPLRDEQSLFEFLVLETFQAGLSWITILRKREYFRLAFDHFDYKKIARYPESKIASLLKDTGIVRNQLKIRATVHNAQCFIEVQKEFGSFSKYIWAFVEDRPVQNQFAAQESIPATTPLATQISKDLKKRGFKFVGPTVIYAHMQATGMVNDHVVDCFRYQEIQKMS